MNVKGVRRWMRQNGVSRSELARRMGVSRATLYSVLNETGNPSHYTLERLHEVTGIGYDVLIEGVRTDGGR